jgi:hypothetical protein
MGGRIGSRVVYVTREDTNEIVRLNPGDEVPADLAHLVTGRALADDTVTPAPAEAAAAVDETPDASDYEAHTVPQLKDLLKARELPQDGNKADLVARLREADTEAAAAVDEDLGDPGDGDDEQTEE